VAVVPPSPRVLADSSGAPAQIVVVLDAGHGGSPDNDHPDVPYDSGAVAANGLQEKDVALDLVRRTATLLEKDLVKVVLTRDRDVFLDIPTRSDIANRSGAVVMVSIHLNGFSDQAVAGTTVLYPSAGRAQFAQTTSDALAKRLGQLGIQDDGTMLRDNWWVHNKMPTVTVEAAYLTNLREAELLKQDDVRDAIAAGVHDGIEAQEPIIKQRMSEIVAWRAAHPDWTRQNAPAATSANSAASSDGGGHVLLLAFVAGLLVFVYMARRRLWEMLQERPRPGPRRGTVAVMGRSVPPRGAPPRVRLSEARSRQEKLARRSAALERARRSRQLTGTRNDPFL
jgi:N-acetylmuramoyl-L-alanine amidase